jgi:hypothetical protein
VGKYRVKRFSRAENGTEVAGSYLGGVFMQTPMGALAGYEGTSGRSPLRRCLIPAAQESLRRAPRANDLMGFQMTGAFADSVFGTALRG